MEKTNGEMLHATAAIMKAMRFLLGTSDILEQPQGFIMAECGERPTPGSLADYLVRTDDYGNTWPIWLADIRAGKATERTMESMRDLRDRVRKATSVLNDTVKRMTNAWRTIEEAVMTLEENVDPKR